MYKKQLEDAGPANQTLLAFLRQQVTTVEQVAQVAVDAAKGWDLQNSGTIEEVDEVLSRQQRLRGKTTAENLGQADMEIKCLQALKAQMERDAETPVPIESICTYGQLDDALRIYNGRLREAAEDECAQIQVQIGELKKSRKKWNGTLEAMKKPGSIGTLNPIQDLDDAITYYGNLQKRQVTYEIAAHAAGHRRIGKEARGSATPRWIAADARGNR